MARNNGPSRREVLARSAATAAALTFPAGVFSQAKNTIRVGVIGCGGRGTGAMFNSLDADPGVVVWALGDVFQDRLDGSRNYLRDNIKEKERFQVTKDREFVGWDAYKGVVATKPDYVILATPPYARPIHYAAAIEGGCHVFTEKPVATDAPGIRQFLAASDLATQKKLNVVCGTQRRHDLAYLDIMKRIHDGAIGEIRALYSYWNQGGLWSVAKTPQMSEMEWQLRNWLYFTWSSGDHIVEQHVHNIDICNWAMNAHPVKAICLAGRQVRTDAIFGNIYDHFMTQFTYANGVIQTSSCRQIDNTASRVSELIVGTKGTSDAASRIRMSQGSASKSYFPKGPSQGGSSGGSDYSYPDMNKKPDPYMLEHKDLIKAMKSGDYVNEGHRIAETTLTAIMGRMAGYTGAEVTWEQALNSNEKLVPARFEFGPIAVPSIAMPGKTKLA
ncbi:MAG: Gfo/Idh/MocA family oxidoreductase [Armatimonadetes bacterium]|nr:Gfo/Idh/MocA family oxidoreductase [Armatimonadota bacterium]